MPKDISSKNNLCPGGKTAQEGVAALAAGGDEMGDLVAMTGAPCKDGNFDPLIA